MRNRRGVTAVPGRGAIPPLFRILFVCYFLLVSSAVSHVDEDITLTPL